MPARTKDKLTNLLIDKWCAEVTKGNRIWVKCNHPGADANCKAHPLYNVAEVVKMHFKIKHRHEYDEALIQLAMIDPIEDSQAPSLEGNKAKYLEILEGDNDTSK